MRRPIRQALWVREVRTSILAKCQGLEWVEGHTGDVHNEMSHKYAKIGRALPRPPPQKRTTPWDVIRHGELMAPPHKVWTHSLFPSHAHEGFHPLSWSPLRFRRLAWHKWLFGLQSRLGYAHYATFWTDAPVKRPCPHCHRFHNPSLHGTLAFCTKTHPLIDAWLSSWTIRSEVLTWRHSAQRKDLRIAGRWAIPQTLYHVLKAKLGGLRGARKAVGHFQQHVLDNVTAVLADSVPTRPPTRPNPFSPGDWSQPPSLC